MQSAQPALKRRKIIFGPEEKNTDQETSYPSRHQIVSVIMEHPVVKNESPKIQNEILKTLSPDPVEERCDALPLPDASGLEADTFVTDSAEALEKKQEVFIKEHDNKTILFTCCAVFNDVAAFIPLFVKYNIRCDVIATELRKQSEIESVSAEYKKHLHKNLAYFEKVAQDSKNNINITCLFGVDATKLCESYPSKKAIDILYIIFPYPPNPKIDHKPETVMKLTQGIIKSAERFLRVGAQCRLAITSPIFFNRESQTIRFDSKIESCIQNSYLLWEKTIRWVDNSKPFLPQYEHRQSQEDISSRYPDFNASILFFTRTKDKNKNPNIPFSPLTKILSSLASDGIYPSPYKDSIKTRIPEAMLNAICP